jgi:hypothetical protein
MTYNYLFLKRQKRARISYGSCQAILTEGLGMRHISLKFSMQMLTEEQKRKLLACNFSLA